MKKSAGILTSSNGIHILFPPDDNVMLVTILENGNYQLNELQQAFAYLRKQSQLKGDTFLDIGANVGTHTIYAFQEPEIKHAFAVEPCLKNIELLRLNCRLNNLVNVKTVHSAIGDINGHIDMIISPNNCGDCRLKARSILPNHLREHRFKTENVPVNTLDKLIEKNEIDLQRVALVWIDTQGSEGLILGTSESIKQNNVPIFAEFWPYGLNKLDCYPLLRDFILHETKGMVRFTDNQIIEYRPEDIENIYNEFSKNSGFCDLLLLR